MILTKFQEFVKKYARPIVITLIIVLSLAFVFGLGLNIGAHNFKRPPLIIKTELLPTSQLEQAQNDNLTTPSSINNSEFLYVASVNGKYYYLPNCSGVNRIKEENKIWFKTKEEAESKGYKPAPNCVP